MGKTKCFYFPEEKYITTILTVTKYTRIGLANMSLEMKLFS